MGWPPKVDYKYVYERPARQVFVPAILSQMSGTKMAHYDTELYAPETGIQVTFFQRQLGQAFASMKAGYGAKDERFTNVVQPSQLPQPYQFSLFGIAADYPIERFENTSKFSFRDTLCNFEMLKSEGRVRFAHLDNRDCFECRLSELPTLESLEKKTIPDWFIKNGNEFLEYCHDRVCGISDKPFPAWAEKWTPEKDYRHIQCGDAFQVSITWEKPINIVCPIKISLYGVNWFPR